MNGIQLVHPCHRVLSRHVICPVNKLTGRGSILQDLRIPLNPPCNLNPAMDTVERIVLRWAFESANDRRQSLQVRFQIYNMVIPHEDRSIVLTNRSGENVH